MKNILTTLTIILILSNLSCNSIDNSLKITEDQVKETVSNFFASIEVGSELNTNDYITDDFKIVEPSNEAQKFINDTDKMKSLTDEIF